MAILAGNSNHSELSPLLQSLHSNVIEEKARNASLNKIAEKTGFSSLSRATSLEAGQG